MKAIFFHHHGGSDVLEYADLPTPEPGPGEVQVKIAAAALNRLDVWVRNGWPGIKLAYCQRRLLEKFRATCLSRP